MFAPGLTSIPSKYHPSVIRVEAHFIGRVQGVGFRAAVERIARRWPVGGWVRNEDDGSVLVVAEGREDSVRAFLEQVRSEMARHIARFHQSEVPAAGESGFRGFEVRR